ncbi:MAG: ion transporter [Gemmataceae bacterium]|nr:ion transporter [Gemmataceae bacterium]
MKQALQAWCEKTALRSLFQNFILVVIVLNSALIGFETSPYLEHKYADLFWWLNHSVQAIFVVEILIRLMACHPGYLNFFKSGWNIFDFTVVALTFLPEFGELATIVRMARVLRITRLVTYSPELRLIVDTMFRSIPSMGHVILLLGLLLYVYGVLGVNLFRGISPEQDIRWGNLDRAVWTMFQTITFENWVGVADPVMVNHPWAWIFFATFILLGVFVGINLFVAVVMNNLDEVKEEHEQAKHVASDSNGILERVQSLKAQLEELEKLLQRDAKPK